MNRGVYLAGPITGCSYDVSRFGWRVDAQSLLNPIGGHGVDVFSPLRSKSFLEGVEAVDGSPHAYKNVANGLASPKGITTRDRWDCQRADVVLVNFLGATAVSIGTCIELGWADAARVPLVVAMEPGNVHEHAIVNEVAGYICDTLEGACTIVRALLVPGV